MGSFFILPAVMAVCCGSEKCVCVCVKARLVGGRVLCVCLLVHTGGLDVPAASSGGGFYFENENLYLFFKIAAGILCFMSCAVVG